MITWFTKEDFWAHLESKRMRIDYVGWCFFHIPYADLRVKIGDITPNQDLRKEDDPPGPVSRWYGDASGIPFLLDFHHDHPRGEVVVVCHADQEDARNIIRDALRSWGDRWQESEIG